MGVFHVNVVSFYGVEHMLSVLSQGSWYLTDISGDCASPKAFGSPSQPSRPGIHGDLDIKTL